MQNGRNTGINAALISALFLGLAPVFGKAAMGAGKFSPLGVVALRTSMAALLLVIIMAVFKREIPLHLPGGPFRLLNGRRSQWDRFHLLLYWLE